MTANRKRILLWSTVFALVTLGLVYAFAPRPVPIDLIAVERDSMVVTVEEEGKTRIHDVFVLSAPVAGQLRRIDVHAGDAVVAGETELARIEAGDSSFLDPRSDAQARAAVQAAESACDLSAARVEEAGVELEFSETEFRRTSELVIDKVISRQAHDDAERRYKTAKAALATARAEAQVRLFELEQARMQLLSPAEVQGPNGEGEGLPITAPVSGRILKIFSASARVVAAGEALMEIGDPAELEIVVDFLSADAVRIRSGQRVILDRWGGDEALPGEVRSVEPFGFTKVSALGIEEQRVNVIIDFDGPPERWDRLGHGYQVEARVVLWEADDVLTVPLTALFRDDREWAVFLEENGRARLRRVELGKRNGLVAQVLGGLEEGDAVVAHPSNRVRDGVRIVARG